MAYEIQLQSGAAMKITMSCKGKFLATGTAFLWEFQSKIYLVTNWHNVAGKDSITGAWLNKNSVAPDQYSFTVQGADAITGKHIYADVIYRRDDFGTVWYQHPTLRGQVDVALLPFQPIPAKNLCQIKDIENQRIYLRPGEDAFILGFPLGIEVEKTPIWKRATVASEPEIDVDGLPKMLVDTATYRGMSGAPVIRRVSNGPTKGGDWVHTMEKVELLGVYSGRLTFGTDKRLSAQESQLGVVWKTRALRDIALGRQVMAIDAGLVDPDDS
ncbi:serine protease [uncultured Tateyamaria sp.]|uniref:S1 family peptidase n=1 Tax=uncultured Tateyamaria sp. TaxID=455651 RepID=UPI0026071FF0|nr:serine protease [uncultured Tateyamaria sp.]